MITSFSALPILETRTRWRTRPCVLTKALRGDANAARKSGLRTWVSDRNLTLMNPLAMTLSASDVRSAQCTFSNSQVRHLAPTAKTATVKCSGVGTVVSSPALDEGKIAPTTSTPSMSGNAGDTLTLPAPNLIPPGAPWRRGWENGEGRWERRMGSHLVCWWSTLPVGCQVDWVRRWHGPVSLIRGYQQSRRFLGKSTVSKTCLQKSLCIRFLGAQCRALSRLCWHRVLRQWWIYCALWLLIFFSQAHEQEMGLRSVGSMLASTRDFAHLDDTLNASSCLGFCNSESHALVHEWRFKKRVPSLRHLLLDILFLMCNMRVLGLLDGDTSCIVLRLW